MNEETEEYELAVTERNVEDFKNDPVWIEMVRTLQLRRIGYVNDLIKAEEESITHRIRGCINEIDYAMNQPDFILQEIEDRKRDEDNEPEESGKPE